MKINSIKKLFLFTFTCVLLGFLIVSKGVAADLQAPQLVIKDTAAQLKEKLKDETFRADFLQFNAFVDEVIKPHVDFPRFSLLVLGKLWKKASKEEKLRFQKEFQTLLVRSYSRAFVDFNDWTINFLPLKIKEGKKTILVKTEIMQPGVKALDVNYRMLFTKGQWKIYDIMVAGASLVINYRSSMKNQYKKTGSMSALIDELARKNAEALAKNKS